MYQAINAAVIASIEDGIANSCSLMVPCPGARGTPCSCCARGPQIPFGIHLTLVCDTPVDRWVPLTVDEKVPSLLDETGRLFATDRVGELLARAHVDGACG
jgi:predicted glycoside hydrolase/deacetylase ChbG (UPF0249 family)